MNNIASRLTDTLAVLGIRQAAMAKKLDIQPSNLSQILKGNRPLGKNLAIRIEQAYDVNSVWLLTGEGEMLRTEPPASNAKEVGGVYAAGQKDDEVVMVDFVPVAASASFIESICDGGDGWDDKYPLVAHGNERNEIERLKVFEVEGDSMFPTIPSHSLILAKMIPERSWHYAEGVVVAVFSEFVVVKRIAANKLLTDNCLVLKSDNEEYGVMTVALADLRALFKAKRIISSPIN